MEISDREQRRIGQDLHDGLCQQLAAIGCAARALADDLSERAVPEWADAEKIEEAIQRTVLETRGGEARIGIEAPAGVAIVCDELPTPPDRPRDSALGGGAE